jgi:hypothetical protein
MKDLLFQAMPTADSAAWQSFLQESQEVHLPIGGEQLSASLWLLPAENDETYLELARIGHRFGIASRCLTIVHAGQWQNLSSAP